jgi:hypothetical protein
MRKTSLASAKAHLWVLVDEAQHLKKRTLILRHGKPAAAIVPVEVAVPAQRVLTQAEIQDLFAPFGLTSPERSAVDDLFGQRR